jgi:hypothetical protein
MNSYTSTPVVRASPSSPRLRRVGSSCEGCELKLTPPHRLNNFRLDLEFAVARLFGGATYRMRALR